MGDGIDRNHPVASSVLRRVVVFVHFFTLALCAPAQLGVAEVLGVYPRSW
jgi:hypothetical protein